MAQSGSFLGKGWSFPPRVGPRGGIQWAADEVKVAQSIGIILKTAPGERLMRPRFGAGLGNLVFAPLTSQTLSRVSALVRDGLRDWEPRIELEQVRVEVDPAEESKLLIHVGYRVRATNTRANLVYPYYIQEGGEA